MGKTVLTNCRIFTGGADLTSNENKISLEVEYGDSNTTNFGSAGWRECLAGLASAKVAGEGQWEAGDPSKVDDTAWAQLGGVGPWTVCPLSSTTAGDLAYVVKAMEGKYTLLGQLGETAPWSAEASSSVPVARGSILHPSGTARTVTGTGTGIQLGAVPAGDSLYANLHVLSIAGTSTPTITVQIESAAANTFVGATTRLSFTAATALGGQASSVAGAITDTWWRAKWTISGTTPSFLFVVSAGIQ